jgi:hypothetical protein
MTTELYKFSLCTALLIDKQLKSVPVSHDFWCCSSFHFQLSPIFGHGILKVFYLSALKGHYLITDKYFIHSEIYTRILIYLWTSWNMLSSTFHFKTDIICINSASLNLEQQWNYTLLSTDFATIFSSTETQIPSSHLSYCCERYWCCMFPCISGLAMCMVSVLMHVAQEAGHSVLLWVMQVLNHNYIPRQSSVGGSEVLAPLTMNSTGYWAIMPCALRRTRSFNGIQCLFWWLKSNQREIPAEARSKEQAELSFSCWNLDMYNELFRNSAYQETYINFPAQTSIWGKWLTCSSTESLFLNL